MEWKRDSQRHYDRVANIYEELYGVEQARKHSIALSLLKVGVGDVVIDVGCGNGTLLKALAKLGSLAVGVDVSKEMLKAAKRKLGSEAYLTLADAEALPFRGGGFTAAFLVTVIHDLPNPLRCLEEVYRVLKPGGACFTTWLKKAGRAVRLEDLLVSAGLRPREALDFEGVQDLMATALKEDVEARAYLKSMRNVKRGLELRSSIIRLLKSGEHSVSELARRAGLSYSSVLRQLRNLEREGVVERLGKPPYRWRLTGRGQLSMFDYLTPS